MTWIAQIDELEAQGLLKKIYEEVGGKRGKLSNIMKVQSLNPPAMKAHLELYMSIMFARSGISREDRELIATVVSSTNNCQYCKLHHVEALNHYWKDRQRIERFMDNYTSVDLPERTRAMLDYSVKLTASPSKIASVDIEQLRSSGFSDEDILNINLVTSYFNFVNRIAEGLGVEFSPEEIEGYNY